MTPKVKAADCTHSDVTVTHSGGEVEKGRCNGCGHVVYRAKAAQ